MAHDPMPPESIPMKPTFFATPGAFRVWLTKHHRLAREFLVGFRKMGSGEPSITWPEAVDQALCFGWIDGVRRRLSDSSYAVRFTPRKPGSTWSAVNIARVAELEAEGSMRPAGRRAFAQRSAEKSRMYSYERSRAATLEPALQAKFEANRKAWGFFQSQAPSYQRKVIHWITSAKQAETRLARLTRLMTDFAAGRKP
jgi:uncharacterized protein YdeI (YjbR/CyaY-like superfamily)